MSIASNLTALHRLDLGRLQSGPLSGAEQQVAQVVLLAPEKAMHFSMAKLAQQAGVSEPTVARFCRNTGFNGFKDFKTWLANSVGAGAPFNHRNVTGKDSLPTVFDIVMERSLAALSQVRVQTSQKRVEEAVKLLSQAARIECYGMGNSGITAQDAAHKFFRLGIPSTAHADPHIHAVAAAMLTKTAVVLAFSNSGRSKELITTLTIAQQVGAKIIVLAPINSPIADIAQVVLNVNQSDDPDLTAPMTTRLCQLALIDVLAVSVALTRRPEVEKKLTHYKNILEDKRVKL
jgi:RpiR family transcriptional regulator, carbohydrate utilization regulator